MKQKKRQLSKKWAATAVAAMMITAVIIALAPWNIMAESQISGDSLEPSESPEHSESLESSESPEPSASPESSESPEPSASPESSESLEPSESPEPSASPELNIVNYDQQPATVEEVQQAIDAYTAAYTAAYEEGGYPAAALVQKPHWEMEVDSRYMPAGYNCQLVTWDETFAAEYYTFFVSITPLGVGSGNFVYAPPGGPDVTDYFQIRSGDVDTVFPNVAIVTRDTRNDYGSMWSHEKLDLTRPFYTDIYLHLGHQDGTGGTVADGMTFALHNDSAGINAQGGVGEGLGVYRGRRVSGGQDIYDGSYIRNSLVIEFDTYYNTGFAVNDPTTQPHCALVIPRSDTIRAEDHQNSFTFAVSQKWVRFEVSWEPSGNGGTLKYTFDNTTRSYYVSNIYDTFGGKEVHWGFTGTTGSYTAVQAGAIVKLPIPSVQVSKTVKNAAGQDINGGTANEGDRLTYSVTMASEQGHYLGPINIEDALSADTDYAGGNVQVTTSSGSNFSVTPAFNGNTMTVKTGHILNNPGDWITITFDVTVKSGAAGKTITNVAYVYADNLYRQKSNETRVSITDNLIFYKVDDNNNPLAGATFEIYRCTQNHTHGSGCSWNAGTLYKSGQQSGSSGAVSFAGIEVGAYILVEKSAPAGYVTPSASSYILLNVLSDGSATMAGYGDFATTGMVNGIGTDPYPASYKIRNRLAAVDIQVRKVIGNLSSQSAEVQAELAKQPFSIKLEGSFTGGVTLKHGESSGVLTTNISSSSIIILTETVPMEYSDTYTVSTVITHMDGRQETQTGRIIIIQPGDSVSITVSNAFIPRPFFKASDWKTNILK